MSKYYKHPRYGFVYGKEIVTPVGRSIWLHLVTPREAPKPTDPKATPGAPRYEANMLLGKTDPETIAFQKEVAAQVAEMLVLFNEGRSAKLGSIDTFFGDGDELNQEKYPFGKGHYILTARNRELASGPRDRGLKLLDEKSNFIVDRSVIKGGMHVRGVVVPIVTAHGASFKLEGLQFVSDDGTRFGGGVRDMTELLDAVSEGPSQLPQTALTPISEPEPEVAVAETTPAETETVAASEVKAEETAPQALTPDQIRAQIAAQMQQTQSSTPGARSPSGRGLKAAVDKL